MNAKLLELARASSRVAWLLCCVACLAICGVRLARAQEAAEPPEYRALVSEALAEFEAGHFEEARALFLHAHVINPSARTLRGLGLSSFELRSYRATIEYLEQALASPLHPLEGTLRSGTEQLLRRAHAFVGRFTPRLEPAHARLRVDGIPVGSSPSILLDIGAHVVTAEAQGYLSETRTLQVLGGEDVLLMMSLAAVSTAVASTPAPLPPIALPSETERTSNLVVVSSPTGAPETRGHVDGGTKRQLYRNPWLWSGVAVAVVAAVVVGSVVAASHNGDKTNVEPVALTGNTGGIIHGLGAAL